MSLECEGGTTDVIVVGAGLAGLSAARALEAAGLSCQVLEAQDRPGGRVRSSVGENGRLMEEGAQFLNRDMHGSSLWCTKPAWSWWRLEGQEQR